MAGPGGKEVGRLNLKVLPDTSNFGTSLRKYVERIERQVVVELPVQLNTKAIAAEIEAVQKVAEKVGAVDLKVTFDKDSVGAFIAELSAVTADRQVEVDIAPNLADFGAKVQAAAEKAAIAAQVNIPLGLEGDNLRVDMAAIINEIEATSKIELNTEVDGIMARAKLLGLIAEMETLARINPPTVNVDLDTGAALTKFAAFQAATKLAGGGASHVGRQIALWGPLIFVAAAGIAAIGPALAVLFPLFGGLIAGVAAIALGFKQLKEAFKPLIEGFKGMRKEIGTVLTAGLAPLIKTFAAKFLPVVEGGLKQFATLINGALKGLLTFLGSAEGLSLLDTFFTSVATALKPFASLLAPVVEMFLRLSVAAAPALEMMGNALLRVTEQFNGFLASGGGTETITASMRDLGEILSILGSVGATAFKALFASVPAVIAALSGMRDVLNVLFRAATPVFEFMSRHTKTMKILGAIVLAVAIAVGVVSAALAVLGILTASAFTLVAAGVAAIAVVLGYLYKENETFRNVVNKVWTAIKVAFAALVVAFKVGFDIAKATFLVFAAVAKNVFAVLTVIFTVLMTVVRFVASVFVAAFAIIKAGLSIMVAVFTGGFAVVRALITGIINVARFLAVIFAAAFAAVRVALSVLAAGFRVWANGVKVSLAAVRAVVSAVVGFVRARFADLRGILSVAGAAWGVFKSAISGAVDGVKTILSGLRDKLKSAISNPMGILKSVGRDIMEGLASGIRGAVSSAVGAVKGAGKKVKDAAIGFFKVGSPSKLMRDDVGQWIPKGIAAGITRYAHVAQRAIDNLVDIPEVRPSVSMGNVDDAGAALAGSINATVAARGATSTRFVIEDWKTGMGYFGEIADDTLSAQQAINSTAQRMGVPA